MSKLQALVETLTAEQAKELRDDAKISAQKLCDYRKGRRRPTLAHAKAIAIVHGVNFAELAEEMANEDASPDQLTFFRRALEGAPRVLGAALAGVLLSHAQPADAAPHSSADAERGRSVSYVN